MFDWLPREGQADNLPRSWQLSAVSCQLFCMAPFWPLLQGLVQGLVGWVPIPPGVLGALGVPECPASALGCPLRASIFQGLRYSLPRCR